MIRFSNPHTIQIPERKQIFHQCALLSQMSFWNLFRQKNHLLDHVQNLPK